MTDTDRINAVRAAQRVVARIIARVEMRPGAAPDMVRVLRDERLALQARTQRNASAKSIRERTAEAVRVARMWGVEVAQGLPFEDA